MALPVSGINPAVLAWARKRSGQSIEQVAEALGKDPAVIRSWEAGDQANDHALRSWRAAVENAGVFVFKDSFKQKDVSGFSLYDDELPVVYINKRTAKTRQMFTLFHEIGHLLTHTSGITKRDDSHIDGLHGHPREIEVFCNRFAADVLVPDSAFSGENLTASDDNIARLARRYRVSREVILRRLLDRGAIPITITGRGSANGQRTTSRELKTTIRSRAVTSTRPKPPI